MTHGREHFLWTQRHHTGSWGRVPPVPKLGAGRKLLA